MILNSRPLSYVSTEDIEEPLTPSHLLTGRRILSLPDAAVFKCESDDMEISQGYLTKRMRYVNRMLDHFWRRWQTEYLLELRECHRYSGTRDNADSTILTGDIVIVHDEYRPRGFWKLARVEEVVSGTDGRVGSAIVQVHSRGTRTTRLRRPLKCLYPLEVRSSIVNSDDVQSKTSGPVRRLKRAAASTARDGIKACVQAYECD